MPAHILLVEDTEELGENIRDVLTFEGLDVTWTKDGLLALEAMNKNKPDLIITDIVMPRMNGLELINHVRAAGLSNTPIIILSAKASPEDRASGLAAGATFYLKKPCSSEQLVEVIKSLLLAEDS